MSRSAFVKFEAFFFSFGSENLLLSVRDIRNWPHSSKIADCHCRRFVARRRSLKSFLINTFWSLREIMSFFFRGNSLDKVMLVEFMALCRVGAEQEEVKVKKFLAPRLKHQTRHIHSSNNSLRRIYIPENKRRRERKGGKKTANTENSWCFLRD